MGMGSGNGIWVALKIYIQQVNRCRLSEVRQMLMPCCQYLFLIFTYTRAYRDIVLNMICHKVYRLHLIVIGN